MVCIIVNYYDLFDGLSSCLNSDFSDMREYSYYTIILNQIIAELASQHNCRHVDVYSLFMHHCYGGEVGDNEHLYPEYLNTPLLNYNIHPVTAGHEAIYNEIYHVLSMLHR